MAGHPPWIEQREDDEQVAELRAMTPEQRLEHFVQACELAIAILRERPDAAAILARREPLSPETEAQGDRVALHDDPRTGLTEKTHGQGQQDCQAGDASLHDHSPSSEVYAYPTTAYTKDTFSLPGENFRRVRKLQPGPDQPVWYCLDFDYHSVVTLQPRRVSWPWTSDASTRNQGNPPFPAWLPDME